ncbi:unnamed protein product [Gongylonema pulchrum]|uniref:G-patch domain-containing protein n=1 Tax=Gongylonema pulchrum TaxID=637853 RepID=A0A183DPH1_9BILA|nr:unnamed protein product [Gongylonema pulchrum]
MTLNYFQDGTAQRSRTCKVRLLFAGVWKVWGHLEMLVAHMQTPRKLEAPSMQLLRNRYYWEWCFQENKSIAEMLRETANEFLRERFLQGFEFVKEHNLYYNPVTGYYYDENTGLFYHAATRCYYYYDSQTDNYVYYSRLQCDQLWRDKLAERRAFTLFGASYASGMSQDEVDVFECLCSLLRDVSRLADTDQPGCDDPLEDGISTLIQNERMEYAPCLRIVNQSSGALYVIIADVSYDEEKQKYFVRAAADGAEISINGQKLNCIAPAAVEHGDEWQFEAHTLLVHIHHAFSIEGTNTCSACEQPLLKSSRTVSGLSNSLPDEKISKETQRRRILQDIKKQYGIYNASYCFLFIQNKAIFAVGSVCTGHFTISGMTIALAEEKPSSSKVLDESSRGFNLLQKMGWKQGCGLGRKEDGITEPIICEVRPERVGLGMKKDVNFQISGKQSKKQHIMHLTRQRYEKSEIFLVDNDQDDENH